MSKGPGRIERAIVDLLEVNKHMSARALAAMVYQTDDELATGRRPVTAAENAAVRRALSNLQKRGAVVKLGHIFHGERCSYASRAHALVIAAEGGSAFGPGFLKDHPALARLVAEARR